VASLVLGAFSTITRKGLRAPATHSNTHRARSRPCECVPFPCPPRATQHESLLSILRRTRPAVGTPVSSAVSRSAHHGAMARLHSTSRDCPALTASSRRPWRTPRPRGTSDVHVRAAARVFDRIVWAGAARERRLSGAELSVEEWSLGISPTAPTASGMDLGDGRCNLGAHTSLPRVCVASNTNLQWATAAARERRTRSEPPPSMSRQWTPAGIRKR